MRASDGDWSGIRRFVPGEFPAGVLDLMDFEVIRVLSEIRDRLPASHALVPSPVAGAHVRPSGNSRHSNTGGRLSDATDFFVRWEHAWDAWAAILRHPEVGGAGIYPNMTWGGVAGDRAMFHIDLRPNRIMWVGYRDATQQGTRYAFLHSDPRTFHRVLAVLGRDHSGVAVLS